MLRLSPTLRVFGVLAAGLGLTGCGGGETLIVQPQEFTGPVSAADYVGRTFPVFVVIGESGDPSARTFASEGSITYNSATSLDLRLPGSSPVTLPRRGNAALGAP